MNANQLIGAVARITGDLARTGERLVRSGLRFAAVQGQRIARASRGPKPEMDDATLKAKVETELFRPADSPKGSVDVTVVDGIVQLRGEARNPRMVRALAERVRAIPEVRGVDNLLHLPKTPAPTRTDTPARERRRAARSGRPR